MGKTRRKKNKKRKDSYDTFASLISISILLLMSTSSTMSFRSASQRVSLTARRPQVMRRTHVYNVTKNRASLASLSLASLTKKNKNNNTNKRSLVCLAASSEAVKKPAKKPEEKVFTPPVLDPNTPSPIFGGGTGGLLRKAQVEEFYVITWDGPKEQIFEMPTGGSAIMRKGGNLLKQPRKEHCMALLTQLRTKFKIDGCIYRVFPSGEVQYLHPKDGVYPEKVNKGREAVNTNDRSIGQNVNPSKVKFTGKNAFEI